MDERREWREIRARTGAMPRFLTGAPLPPPEPPGRSEPDRPGDERPRRRRRKGRRYVNTRKAAKLVGLSPRTLDTYRCTGAGPRYYRFGGCVRYRVKDLDAWAAGRRRR